MMYWDKTSFITLTYDDDNLPLTYGLVKEHLTGFLKNLRNDMYSEKREFKYYAVGEYGEKYGRPHYHLIMYGIDDQDEETINQRWSKGLIDIGTCTPESIQYVAGYVQKKLYADRAKEQYGDNEPPYSVMSKGIGLAWAIDNYKKLEHDQCIFLKGKKIPIPRYFIDKLKIEIDETRMLIETCEQAFEWEMECRDRGHTLIDFGDVARKQRLQRDKNLKAQKAIRNKEANF